MLIGSALTAYVRRQCAALYAPLAQVVVAGLAMQFFFFSMWCVIYAYTSELYPIRARDACEASRPPENGIGRVIFDFS